MQNIYVVPLCIRGRLKTELFENRVFLSFMDQGLKKVKKKCCQAALKKKFIRLLLQHYLNFYAQTICKLISATY